MRLVVWNMHHGKIREKLELLRREAKFDMAVLLEIDGSPQDARDGKWEDFVSSLDHESPRGIRIWHKPEVTVEQLKTPDLSGVSIARAYRVTPPAGVPFDFVAYWAVKPVKLPYGDYAEGMRDLLPRCRGLFSGDLLIAGDTNLQAAEVEDLERDLADVPGTCLLRASDGGGVRTVLGAEKQPCDTLLHCGKWWPCDLGIASAALAERVKVCAGDWRTWIKPVGVEKTGSDHLPVFFDL